MKGRDQNLARRLSSRGPLRCRLAVEGQVACSVECGLGADGVDLLCGALRRGAKGGGRGDAVAVAVGGHGSGMAPPGHGGSFVLRRGAEHGGPVLAVVEGLVEDRVGAGLDEVASFGERLAHVGGHGAGGFGDEPDDQTWSLAGAAGAGGTGGGLGNAVVEDGGDVVGVGEPARSDQSWQQRPHVVVVGLGAAELDGQRPEGVGGDRVVGLVIGEPGGADKGDPAVVLCGCGDGLVLGGELGDRGPGVLLGGDGLVRGQLGADVLEDSEQDAAAGGLGVVAGVRPVVCSVGLVDRDVGHVRLAAAGEGDVQVLPCHGGVDQDVRDVGRDPLRPVRRDGVRREHCL